MKHRVIRILLVPALSLQLAASAFAGYDEGFAAYGRGNYATAFEAAGDRPAEIGCTTHEIAAILGHDTCKGDLSVIPKPRNSSY